MPPAEPDADNRDLTAPAASPSQPGPSSRLRGRDAPNVPGKAANRTEYEEELFDRILRGARVWTTPLPELRTNADALVVPGKVPEPNDASPLVAGTTQREENWSGGLDTSGNPRWITLSLPEREQTGDRIVPQSVPPPSLASHPKKPNQQKNGQQRQQPTGFPRFFPSRLTLSPRFPSDAARPHAQRIRPMRGFFRMIVVTAILAMLYHILSQRGWVPRLF